MMFDKMNKKGSIDVDQVVKLLLILAVVAISIYLIAIFAQNQSATITNFFEGL